MAQIIHKNCNKHGALSAHYVQSNTRRPGNRYQCVACTKEANDRRREVRNAKSK